MSADNKVETTEIQSQSQQNLAAPEVNASEPSLTTEKSEPKSEPKSDPKSEPVAPAAKRPRTRTQLPVPQKPIVSDTKESVKPPRTRAAARKAATATTEATSTTAPTTTTESATAPPKKVRKPAVRKNTAAGPKKNRSAYMFFCDEERPKLKGTGLTPQDTTKKLGALWKETPESAKTKFQDLAAKDKARYNEERTKLATTEAKSEE
ncbi:hypothetical protein Pelo_12360 [Pelomyxa schiedti]|nr:hypothetical protein Pelo_12915 [Pelomyxa schiedti]KAH3746221.1 hypothetical protein Pelo_12360 [Pelomyxa schiedti]